jgi:phosphoribosylaminoimidazole carboxylase PurE protein
MKEAETALTELKIGFHTEVVSAHRTPDEMFAFAKSARKNGFQVIIAGAGGAAHLPGMVASLTELPVIGVPVAVGALQGQDSLLSIVQMPKGVPVATVAIGNAFNAGILAAQILAASLEGGAEELFLKIKAYKEGLKNKVLAAKNPGNLKKKKK